MGTLAAACANVKSGRMPLPRYLMLHPEARLSAQDQATLCEWTGIEIARLLSEKRQSGETRSSQHRPARPKIELSLTCKVYGEIELIQAFRTLNEIQSRGQ